MTEKEKRAFQRIRVFFTGVGGQGTLLATRLAGEAALEEGLAVSLSEIHGMAQRGGVVESCAVIGDLHSSTIADGEADILMAFEPLEAVRALPKCHVNSWVISNTVPIIPFTVATGQSKYPEAAELFHALESTLKKVILLDASELAHEAGTDRAANMVMMGVLAGIDELPISLESWRKALKKVLPHRLHEVNEEAFSLGFKVGSEAI